MSDVVALPDGGRVALAARGTGPPLLLVRPLGGSLDSWGAFADHLARRLRVVAFDARGTGCSSPAPFGTTTRSMAADAVAVLDAVGLPRAHVYGISLGGMVASWLALDAPARVGRLVLASTPAAGRAVHPGGWRRALRLGHCLLRSARATEVCLATEILSDGFRARDPAEVQRIRARAAARPASRRGLFTLLGAALAHDLGDRLGELAVDTLVVAGADDVLLPPAEQRRLAARLPRARFAVIPEAGHDVSAEAPTVVAARVIEHVLAE